MWTELLLAIAAMIAFLLVLTGVYVYGVAFLGRELLSTPLTMNPPGGRPRAPGLPKARGDARFRAALHIESRTLRLWAPLDSRNDQPRSSL
jgi:hypothetical protein